MSDRRVLATLGLISDTHFQERLFALPDQLARVWGPVDLVLHAGDVGDLSVLDQLGHIAPVVAVHGNDEPDVTKRALPDEQLIPLGGLRLLLWHSHYPDPLEEKANRKGAWGPKLDRMAARAREAGAEVLVYGHSHVPAISLHAGVTLFNPGALASGSFFTRQAVQTVGRLRVLAAGAVEVEHLDLAAGQVVQMPRPDPAEDFGVLGGRYQTSIIEPELMPVVAELNRIQFENIRLVAQSLVPLYRRRFDDGMILRQDLADVVHGSDLVSRNDRETLLGVLERR